MTEDAVDRLQARLGAALDANTPGSGIDHVLIVLPSFSVSESILSHYGDRIASLEHRYLNSLLVADRIPEAEVVFLSTRQPDDDEIEAVLSALPANRRQSVRDRLRLFAVDDGTARPVAAKVLDQPDLLANLKDIVGDRPALIEPWNVTEPEIALALALDVPINGTRPELRGLGFKGAGRSLLTEAGVPVPLGRENIRSVDDIVEAAVAIRAQHPRVTAIVVKLDDSGAGDGNVVLGLPSSDADVAAAVRESSSALPVEYLAELSAGGIVEERITGTRFSSPSAQVDIRPGGRVVVLATHEQLLGGPGNQVYLGCRFPADLAYSRELGRHAAAVGHALARRGALGRFSLDFVAAAEGSGPWQVFGIEINLRKGGTTHPYSALRSVVPGHYDVEAGAWVTNDHQTRCYSATDNVVDPQWTGLQIGDVVRAVTDAGLLFDPATRTGVVLHMLAGLAIDGRFGLTAIAKTPAEADQLEAAVRDAVGALAARSARPKRVTTPGE